MGYELIKGESAHVSKGSPKSELSFGLLGYHRMEVFTSSSLHLVD